MRPDDCMEGQSSRRSGREGGQIHLTRVQSDPAPRLSQLSARSGLQRGSGKKTSGAQFPVRAAIAVGEGPLCTYWRLRRALVRRNSHIREECDEER